MRNKGGIRSANFWHLIDVDVFILLLLPTVNFKNQASVTIVSQYKREFSSDTFLYITLFLNSPAFLDFLLDILILKHKTFNNVHLIAVLNIAIMYDFD